MENIYYVGDNALLGDNSIKTSTIQECYEYCKHKKVLSIDIETTRKYNKYGDIEGLDPYTSKIVMFQIGDLDRQYVIDHRVVSIKLLLPLLTSNDIVKVGHNIKFEYKHILHNYNIKLVNVYDTQIVEQILYCGLKDIRFSLLELNRRYLKIEVDKSTRLEFLTIGSKPFTYRHIKYGAEDIINPLRIKSIQESEVLEKQLQNTVSLEMQFLPVLGDIEYKGMNFNKDKWLKVYAIKKPLLIVAKEKIENFITKNYANTKFVSNQLDLFNPDPKCTILWSSPKQVISFFKHINGCPQEVSKQTKKLEYTVNAKLLASSLNGINKSQPDHIKQFIKDYINYKELEQSCTTFGPDYFKYINPITKRLHTNFKQILNTGRISSSDPNLQNIPSEDGYRQAFDVDDEHDIVNCDYGGQETVVLANVSKEPNIGNLIIQGGDMHSFVASHISNELYEDFLVMLKKKDNKEQLSDFEKKLIGYRQTAKAAGFAIQYGGTGFTIAKNLGITQEEGDQVFDAYFKAFPDLKNYFDYVQSKTLKQGYVLIDEVTHRKSYFLSPRNGKEKHAIMKKALNFPIQGASGSMTKYASILFTKWIKQNNLEKDVFITNLVHDEINVECKKNYSNLVAPALENAMLKAASMWCKTVPMKATAVVSDYWGH